MALLQSSLGTFLFNVILTILMVYGFKMLFASAQNSLKRTGGKWTSILDEALMAFVGLAVLMLCWNMGPVEAVNLVIKWVQWLWGLLTPVLRTLGFPV